MLALQQQQDVSSDDENNNNVPEKVVQEKIDHQDVQSGDKNDTNTLKEEEILGGCQICARTDAELKTDGIPLMYTPCCANKICEESWAKSLESYGNKCPYCNEDQRTLQKKYQNLFK